MTDQEAQMHTAKLLSDIVSARDAWDKTDIPTVVYIADKWSDDDREYIRHSRSGRKMLELIDALAPDVLEEAREATRDETTPPPPVQAGPEPGTVTLTIPPYNPPDDSAVAVQAALKRVQDLEAGVWPHWPEGDWRAKAGHFWIMSNGECSEALPFNASQEQISAAVLKVMKAVLYLE